MNPICQKLLVQLTLNYNLGSDGEEGELILRSKGQSQGHDETTFGQK